ncbi:MAG: DSD1 family PLP-dependent enzyme, partial [bacterium]|nr:DSD1 family PLP-dependent enzyme [bacterium]
ADAKALIEAAGIPCPIVSAGGTGTLAFSPACPGLTEIQAGGGIMMDTFYPTTLGVKGLEHALTILATVVSQPSSDRAYIDAGRKTTSNQFGLPSVKNKKGISVTGLSAEHGYLALEPGATLRIGEKLELISGYSDMTVCLHDQFYGIRNNRVEAVWDILGRGKLQ